MEFQIQLLSRKEIFVIEETLSNFPPWYCFAMNTKIMNAELFLCTSIAHDKDCEPTNTYSGYRLQYLTFNEDSMLITSR